jgi:hypothetical protein
VIIPWLVAWLISGQPHVEVLPVAQMNTWGLLLVLAVVLV